MSEEQHTEAPESEEVTDKILTVPNIISFARLCLAPVFLVLLFQGQDLAATILFVIAACTDFIDGQVARRTHQVSKLGQLLDPAVDRILMICCVVGVFVLGRLPLWMIIVVVARDLFLVIAQAAILRAYNVRVPVVYAGKVATTFLFIGLAGLLLNMPLIDGLGLVSTDLLPLFNNDPCSWGYIFIYIGFVIGLVTTIYYIVEGARRSISVIKERSHER